MILYIILAYLIEVGMMVEYYNTIDEITVKGWLTLVLAPITFPIMVGMILATLKS